MFSMRETISLVDDLHLFEPFLLFIFITLILFIYIMILLFTICSIFTFSFLLSALHIVFTLTNYYILPTSQQIYDLISLQEG